MTKTGCLRWSPSLGQCCVPAPHSIYFFLISKTASRVQWAIVRHRVTLTKRSPLLYLLYMSLSLIAPIPPHLLSLSGLLLVCILLVLRNSLLFLWYGISSLWVQTAIHREIDRNSSKMILVVRCNWDIKKGKRFVSCDVPNTKIKRRLWNPAEIVLQQNRLMLHC